MDARPTIWIIFTERSGILHDGFGDVDNLVEYLIIIAELLRNPSLRLREEDVECSFFLSQYQNPWCKDDSS